MEMLLLAASAALFGCALAARPTRESPPEWRRFTGLQALPRVKPAPRPLSSAVIVRVLKTSAPERRA